jgi:peptidase S24-like protein
MIQDDRIQLNERFIEVFNLLVERGDVVLNDRGGRGIGDFAEKILGNRGYGHIIRAFLNQDDKRVIDYRHARTLCNVYGVNEGYLIDGIGTPFGFDLPKPGQQGVPINSGSILFTSVEAFAGSGEAATSAGSSTSEDNEYFSLPGVSGNGLVAFPVDGDSMEPVVMDGDILICRQISGAHEIKDNEIYAIKSNGALWIKYVQKNVNSRGHVTSLKLISANYLEFDPFVEEVNEHTRLFRVIRRISDV